MKNLLALLATALLACPATAAPLKWSTDLGKAIRQATKENKFTFILLGREDCGICQATRRLVNDGLVGVTPATFVAVDIDFDNARVWDDFESRFKKEKFGEVLPYVVITDAKGKPLASYSGPKSAGELAGLVAEAKRKAAGRK